WADYKTLFDDVLAKVARRLDGGRDYVPGSPHTPGRNRKEFHDPSAGDAHLWMVWHGDASFDWYYTIVHRFVSEFGFQSFCEPRTVAAYTAPEDRNITSPVMEHHQRSGIGNSKIATTMLEWFRMPTSFEQTLWLSQIQQAMAIQIAVEHWRRHMPRSMGSLYWQLNDCWPVASWSSLDYFGRWKALHYAAARFHAPVLVSAAPPNDNGIVDVYVTSELAKATTGKFAFRLTTVDGHELAATSKRVPIPSDASKRIERIDLSDPLANFGADNLLLWLDLAIRGRRVSDNLIMFDKPKRLSLLDPKITTKIKPLADGDFAITLKAKRPALWTWLEATGTEVLFNDNFLHLPPGESRTIIATPVKPVTAEQLERKLKVWSLVDTF
ncbi:MAG: glycoside hydrolase family 2 protein, partial [Planctomycetota bacterium]